MIWEKTVNDNFQSFNIYKETGLNEYAQIGNVAYDQPSSYVDYSSQPEAHGDKYKITVIDSSGQESELGPYHKTMNLTVAVLSVESTLYAICADIRHP